MAGPVFFVILPQCDNNPKNMFPCGYYKVSGARYIINVYLEMKCQSLFLGEPNSPQIPWELAEPQLHKVTLRRGCL